MLKSSLAEIAAFFNATATHAGAWIWEPNYNLAPAVVAPVIAHDGQGVNKIVPMRWGLHPHWKRDMPEGRPLFNARIETAFEKPSFRTPWKRRRALIPLNGWYEWSINGEQGDEMGGGKTPYYIHDENDDLTAVAGLWDQYRVDEGITLLSYTILTTAAVGSLKHLHHRMPVRLPRNQWQNWLNPDAKPERVMEHMLGSDGLAFHEVSRAVSSGRSQGANLVLPVVD